MSQSLVKITGQGVISPTALGIDPLWTSCQNQKPCLENGLGIISDEILSQIKAELTQANIIIPETRKQSKSLIMALWSIHKALKQAVFKVKKELSSHLIPFLLFLI